MTFFSASWLVFTVNNKVKRVGILRNIARYIKWTIYLSIINGDAKSFVVLCSIHLQGPNDYFWKLGNCNGGNTSSFVFVIMTDRSVLNVMLYPNVWLYSY